MKLVIEGDDHQTQAGIALLPPSLPFEVVIAPPRGPRTKPKALNAALQFARGSLVAIYDAEDRPDPDQLRIALEAFVAGDAKLACVQARLTIDNTADSCLARMFTAEYAGLFDVFLPGLSARHLPLPLGTVARRTISAPPSCEPSVPGTRTMSPRTPTSACGSPARAIAARSSARPLMRKRRRISRRG